MGIFTNIFKQYQPKGNWNKDKFIKKYSYFDMTNMSNELKNDPLFQKWLVKKNKLIKTQMDNTAIWLKKEIEKNKKMTNNQNVDLDTQFIKKLHYLLGKNQDWLQSTHNYMRIQKDFRKVYNLPSFNF